MAAETHTYESLLGEFIEPPAGTHEATARRIKGLVDSEQVTPGEHLSETFEVFLGRALERLSIHGDVEFYLNDFAKRAKEVFDHLAASNEVDFGDFQTVNEFVADFSRRFKTELPSAFDADTQRERAVGPLEYRDYFEIFNALTLECLKIARETTAAKKAEEA